LAEAAQQENREQVQALEARLAAAESEDAPGDVDPARRNELAAALAADRAAEVDAKLALRTAEERARATAGTGEKLRRAAATEEASRARAQQAARRRAAAARTADRVADVAGRALVKLTAAVDAAAASRAAAEQQRAVAVEAADDARRKLAQLQTEWDSLTDAVHGVEVVRAEQRLKLEQFAEIAANEFAITLDDLVAEF